MRVDQIVTLVAQFACALIIAKLAVNWALARYKSEKIWERQLAAYADVVSAIADRKVVVDRWVFEIEERTHPSEEHQDAQRRRYRAARQRFEDGVAMARLLLPDSTSTALAELERRLDQLADPYEDEHRALVDESSALKRAVEVLVIEARAYLAIPALARGK